MDSGGLPQASISNTIWTAASRTLTNPGGSVQAAQVQPIATASSNANTNGTVNTVNFTGSGVLVTIAYYVTTAMSGGASITVTLNVVADGVTVNIPIITAGSTFDPKGKGMCTFLTGTGIGAGDSIVIPYPIQFTTSLVVSLTISATTMTTGVAVAQAFWAHV